MAYGALRENSTKLQQSFNKKKKSIERKESVEIEW